MIQSARPRPERATVPGTARPDGIPATASEPASCRRCYTPLGAGFSFCPGCGASVSRSSAPTATDAFVGRTIGGAYVIRELVGVGGMGRVYRAEQIALARSVAVKIVHPHLLSDEQAVARFYREARAASALNHPNSVAIIDFGRADDGTLYLVMELLHGQNLAEIAAAEGPLPLHRACRIVIDVLGALNEAHASGVVHRDLKPENIVVEQLRTGRDLVKVLDFGIATLASEKPTSATEPGLLCGTPEYLSPEQASGEPVDGRSDLYAAGVVLFELLTGGVPFSAETPIRTALLHLNAPVPDPQRAAPERGIPSALAAIVRRALAKDPAARFERASDMAEALSIAADLLDAQRSRDQPLTSRRTGVERKTGPFVGRAAELARLGEWLARAQRRHVFVQITGEPGIGKTRLMREFARTASEQGHVVVLAEPHDSLAPVAYWPIRVALRVLFATDDEGLRRLAGDDASGDPFVRAGIREVLTPGSLPTSGQGSPVPAVTRAVSAALRAARERMAADRVLILALDDAQLVDGSSLDVLKASTEGLQGVPLLVCIATSNPIEAWPSTANAAHALALEGFSREEARTYLGAKRAGRESSPDDPRRMLPLYVEQLRCLGLALDGTLPGDLGEAVGGRVQRLKRAARRMLQSAAVLGLRCTRAELSRMCGGDAALDGLEEALASGLLSERDASFEFAHPYVRDLVEASTPAAARCALHARALEASTDAGAPLEVRAQHAAQSDTALTACTLLEEAGAAAARRGDHALAASTFQRGWELARNEATRAPHPALAGAVAALTRQLAAALEAAGDPEMADGILREQADLAEPRSSQRATLLVARGTLALRRGRTREAQHLLGGALDLACEVGAAECEAAAHAAIATRREAEGDVRGALGSLLSAYEILRRSATDPIRECDVALGLGEAMARAGDLAGAVTALEHAERVGRDGKALDLAARALLARARVAWARHNAASARACCREGAELAARAGSLALWNDLEAATAAIAAGGGPALRIP